MGRRLPNTPKSKVRNALRQLWLRSRERAAALKRDEYKCRRCGVKQSVAKGKEQKMEVHHRSGIGNWEKVMNIIYEEILCDPDNLETICPECHGKETNETKKAKCR